MYQDEKARQVWKALAKRFRQERNDAHRSLQNLRRLATEQKQMIADLEHRLPSAHPRDKPIGDYVTGLDYAALKGVADRIQGQFEEAMKHGASWKRLAKKRGEERDQLTQGREYVDHAVDLIQHAMTMASWFQRRHVDGKSLVEMEPAMFIAAVDQFREWAASRPEAIEASKKWRERMGG